MNRDEQRMMMITVVGGVGSIVLGVAIVGTAIALIHFLKKHTVHGQNLGVWVSVGIIVAGLIAIIAGTITPDRPRGISRQALRVITGIAAVGIIIGVLIAIGAAAGVK